MLDSEPTGAGTSGDQTSTSTNASTDTSSAEAGRPRRRRAASRPAGPPQVSAALPVETGGATHAEAMPPAAVETGAQTPVETGVQTPVESPPRAPRKRAAKKTTAAKTAAAKAAAPDAAPADVGPDASGDLPGVGTAPTATAAAEETASAVAPTRTRKRATKKASAPSAPASAQDAATDTRVTDSRATDSRVTGTSATDTATTEQADTEDGAEEGTATGAQLDDQAAAGSAAVAFTAPGVLFQSPEPVEAPAPRRRGRKAAATTQAEEAGESTGTTGTTAADEPRTSADVDTTTAGRIGESEPTDEDDDAVRRRRRRGGRGRRGRGRGEDEGTGGTAGSGGTDDTEGVGGADGSTRGQSDDEAGPAEGQETEGGGDEDREDGTRRRRRRRRRGGGEDSPDAAAVSPDDPPQTVVRVREPRRGQRDRGRDGGEGNDVRGVKGSTRLEAKKQRRREGRDAGRRRPPVLSESEFLARRESVDRVMVARQVGERTQIAVLEDGVLVEHYVSRASSASFVGNVYLGKVQNVLPSMEAAFLDIGKGRNGVLYAGEVNWDAAGLEGQPRRIELALKSGDAVLAQVTKDPMGHKGSRLTSQVSLPGRYLVYVPEGSMTGISRKLPDTERDRLKSILKRIVPDDAGVIVRTAAEGASEEELERDVARLSAQWEDIQKKAKTASAPALLYGEPDLTVRVIRDIFNEDFTQLIVSGDDAWDTVDAYVGHVAPDLVERVSRWTEDRDVFSAYRVDEQLAKGLDRKVWLPSGGYLVIDRTEAMVVVDVNTGKFTGKGGNLEETVTKNNLEAAEEIVHQMRLRDLGGIIVIDFIDMVLEGNRELVMRRLLECLGRDRTKHQVAETTSLGLVQMTRKRVGQGLLEVFSETCERCKGRGLIVHADPVPDAQAEAGPARPGPGKRGGRGGRGRGEGAQDASDAGPTGTREGPKPQQGSAEAVEASPAALEDPVETVQGPGDTAEPATPAKRPAGRRRATRPAGGPSRPDSAAAVDSAGSDSSAADSAGSDGVVPDSAATGGSAADSAAPDPVVEPEDDGRPARARRTRKSSARR